MKIKTKETEEVEIVLTQEKKTTKGGKVKIQIGVTVK